MFLISMSKKLGCISNSLSHTPGFADCVTDSSVPCIYGKLVIRSVYMTHSYSGFFFSFGNTTSQVVLCTSTGRNNLCFVMLAATDDH